MIKLLRLKNNKCTINGTIGLIKSNQLKEDDGIVLKEALNESI